MYGVVCKCYRLEEESESDGSDGRRARENARPPRMESEPSPTKMRVPFDLRFLAIVASAAFVRSLTGGEDVPAPASAPTSADDYTDNSLTKNLSSYWMNKFGAVKDSLMDIQAVIVKDEDATDNCLRGKRKSNRRYLMCAGSILSSIYVLTSASCVHEATHIRHNLQAPLAVIVAPLKYSLQIIKVQDYRIHPLHVEDPYSSEHSKHDIAILKLACRMLPENYRRIQLPKLPMSELCFQEECSIAVFRKTGKNAVALFETGAKHVPMERRRRRRRRRSSASATDLKRQLRKLADPPLFAANFSLPRDHVPKTTKSELQQGKTRGETRGSSNLEKRQSGKSSSYPCVALSDDPLAGGCDGRRLPLPRNMPRNASETAQVMASGDLTVRNLFVRSSDGAKGCPASGAPVMINATQSALVSVSCDDRQPSAAWKYTDIYDNADWITAMMKDWNSCWSEAGGGPKGDKDPLLTNGGAGGPGACSTCVFNFFLEGCNGGNCSALDQSLMTLGLPATKKCSEPKENVRVDLGPVVRVQKNRLSFNYSESSKSSKSYELPDGSQGNISVRRYVPGERVFYATDTKLDDRGVVGKKTFDLNYYDETKMSIEPREGNGFGDAVDSGSDKKADSRKRESVGYNVYGVRAEPAVSGKYQTTEIRFARAEPSRSAFAGFKFLEVPFKRFQRFPRYYSSGATGGGAVGVAGRCENGTEVPFPRGNTCRNGQQFVSRGKSPLPYDIAAAAALNPFLKTLYDQQTHRRRFN